MNDIKSEIFRKAEMFGGIDNFLIEVKDMWTKDIDGVAKIYTRDKHTSSYKVVSLKNGGYSVVNQNKEIIFKNDDLHLCKVEWMMLVHC